MKKLFAILLVFVSLFVLVACGEEEKPAGEKDIFAKSEGVMTYAEYLAAEEKSVVVVETFIQAKQSWWEKDGVGVGTFYTMDKDGGYFIYNMPCSKDDYDNKLKEGAKIKVTGKKSAWAGEVEITDATWVLEEGTYRAPAKELSFFDFNTNGLDYQNQLFALKGLIVEAFDEEGAAFGYKYNGSGERGDDIYFKVNSGNITQTFVIESYLCDKDSDVYKAAEALKVGDAIDVEGFMYWYNNPQPHITKISAGKNIFAKSKGVMTYAEYLAAEEKSDVVIETFIQAKQSWWEKDGVGVGTFYTMDNEGGYFIYNMPCSKDDYDNKLKVGAKIKVTGKKSAWAGEVEITDATWVLEEGTFKASAKELTASVFNSKALDYQNQFFGLKGLTVEAFDEEGAAFGYKYNGSGERGDDIYFKVKVGETEATFVIESYLCDKDSDTYKAAEALKVGDTIDIEGFMYWYNSAQPHVTKITVKVK